MSKDVEKIYWTTEREALAIVGQRQLPSLKNMLRVTNHRQHRSSDLHIAYELKVPNRSRWALLLQPYYLAIDYIPERLNYVADALTPPGKEDIPTISIVKVQLSNATAGINWKTGTKKYNLSSKAWEIPKGAKILIIGVIRAMYVSGTSPPMSLWRWNWRLYHKRRMRSYSGINYLRMFYICTKKHNIIATLPTNRRKTLKIDFFLGFALRNRASLWCFMVFT